MSANDIEIKAEADWLTAKTSNESIHHLCSMFGEPLVQSIWKLGFCDGALAGLQLLQDRAAGAQP